MPAQRERTSIPYHARLHAGVLKREMAEVHCVPNKIHVLQPPELHRHHIFTICKI